MTILSVQVGLPRDVRTEAADGRPATWRSAIWKTPVQGPVWLGEENLAGDGQADRKNHGGPHRAMLWYAAAHYPHWRAELGLETLWFGWFGENLTVEGLDEDSVCIGDVYRIGGPDGPVVQVSQPRKPCWKLARRVGVPDLVSRVESTGRSGWYTRVLKTGWVAPGDTVERLDCPCPEWTIRRAQSVRLGLEMLRRPSRAGAAADGDSPERPLFSRSGEGGVEGVAAAQDARALLDDAEALAACPHLSPDWRHLMRTALQGLRG